jgi:hypothetical protein
MGVDIIRGDSRERLCFGQAVDCEMCMVRIDQAIVTYEAEINDA